MAADEWTMIRVRKSTAEWLRREAENLVHLANVAGNPNVDIHVGDRVGNQPGCGFSLDELLKRWIRQKVRQRARSRKAKGSAKPADHTPGCINV